jgi:ATP-dependent Lhr-like helicase
LAAASGGSIAATAKPGAAATVRLHSLATVMLQRHGVLTREAVASEEVAGGFSGIYPVLRAMEESGRIRRGYFVDGLGAAQFALPGAVDRLRSLREARDQRGAAGLARAGGAAGAGGSDRGPNVGSGGPSVHLLAAADPANPYGAALPWPRRGESDRRPLQRAAGAYVVLVDGAAVLYLERGGHGLQSLPASDDGDLARSAVSALSRLVEDGRMRELVLARVDGEPVAASAWRPLLEEGGFVPGYRGFVLRPSTRRVVSAGRGLPPETAQDNYWRRPAGPRSSRPLR